MTFAFWNLVSGRVNSLSTASVEIITQACLDFTCVTVLSTEELGCQGGALMERVAWGKVEVIGVFWRQWWWCSRSCIYLVSLKVRVCHEDEFMGWGSFRKGEWSKSNVKKSVELSYVVVWLSTVRSSSYSSYHISSSFRTSNLDKMLFCSVLWNL